MQPGNTPDDLLDVHFEVYRSLYEALREGHPQRCELNRSEFARAVHDEHTVCSRIASGDNWVAVPQLVRVDVNDWLNADYFERHFPTATASNTLMHLTLWPGHTPDDIVVERLGELAGAGGTVVLDGPTRGEWSVRESLSRLESLVGATAIRETRLLGTQTYWCGNPRSCEATPDWVPGTLADGARETGRDALPGGNRTGAYLRQELSTDEAAAMFELYSAAYAVLGDHPCAQGVTPEKFRHMMLEDPDMAKVVFQRDGIVESLCLITPRLSTLDWINLEFYEKRFGGALDRGQVHWYPAIATDPGSTGARNGQAIMELLGDIYEAAEISAAIVFDTPDVNSAFLPVYLEELINGLPHYEVRFEVIAEHEYHAVQLGA